VEPKALEVWGRAVVERAAEVILAAIPPEQNPETGSTGRAISAGPGYVSRYVHFRRPDYPAQRAVFPDVLVPVRPHALAQQADRACRSVTAQGSRGAPDDLDATGQRETSSLPM
jgi:hypothetical protein